MICVEEILGFWFSS